MLVGTVLKYYIHKYITKESVIDLSFEAFANFIFLVKTFLTPN